MLSARYAGHESIEIAEVDETPPAPGEVQLRVSYAGICGTDLHIWHGAMDGRVTTPAIIGHEMSGVVAAVGDGVDGWAVGDAATVMPLAWDGTCPACLAGNQHVCQNLDFIGIDSPGALQQLWNVDAATLVRLPATLRLDHAALVEPVAVAVHDVGRSQLTAGERAVIIGGGPIGVLIASVARATGGDVVVVELDQLRRDAAAALGFTTVDPRSTDLPAWVDSWTAGAGADVVFEVSGAASAVLTATDLAKVRGRIVVVAIHSEPRPMNLYRMFWRELTVIGARVYERADFERAVELLTAGEIPADELITSIVPLPEAGDAFETLASGKAMKILIDVQAGGQR